MKKGALDARPSLNLSVMNYYEDTPQQYVGLSDDADTFMKAS